MDSRRKFIKSAGLLASLSLFDVKATVSSFRMPASKQKIKAAKLKPGDTVAITSPAGAVWDEQQVGVFSDILKDFGFRVIYGDTLKKKFGYFAGTDEERAQELNDLFKNKSVKGIFCMKGGWGCARIVDLLNYEIIAQNPKVLIGFSDITTLLISIYVKTGLITFHGPVGNSGWNEYTSKVFKDIVMGTVPVQFPVGPAVEDQPVTFNKGSAQGVLVGGNLSVISGCVGSRYLPDWKGKILFLEEWKEEPYSIDRMLTQMKLAGILNDLSGIVFGKCVKCEAEEPQKAFTFMEVLEQHIKPLGIPAFYGAQIGHIENKLTIPIGAEAIINANLGTIKLKESGVI